jgi:inhibitor of cysteine peptidase
MSKVLPFRLSTPAREIVHLDSWMVGGIATQLGKLREMGTKSSSMWAPVAHFLRSWLMADLSPWKARTKIGAASLLIGTAAMPTVRLGSPYVTATAPFSPHDYSAGVHSRVTTLPLAKVALANRALPPNRRGKDEVLTVDMAQNGDDLEMGIGESLELRLPENPTTGYRWQTDSAGKPALELEEESFEPSLEAYGASGIRRWRFRSVQKGVAHLKMDRRRSWERQAVETFTVTIRIEAR